MSFHNYLMKLSALKVSSKFLVFKASHVKNWETKFVKYYFRMEGNVLWWKELAQFFPMYLNLSYLS